MNGKKSRQLRTKSKQLMIEWLRSMTPEGEDKERINEKNLHEFLPEQTHIFANNKFMVSAYTLRWFYKHVKKNPSIKLEELVNAS
tara:strand:+ start:459 stop:713 length:255 start_codon:yes stop_codon:yes gene_type:complete